MVRLTWCGRVLTHVRRACRRAGPARLQKLNYLLQNLQAGGGPGARLERVKADLVRRQQDTGVHLQALVRDQKLSPDAARVKMDEVKKVHARAAAYALLPMRCCLHVAAGSVCSSVALQWCIVYRSGAVCIAVEGSACCSFVQSVACSRGMCRLECDGAFHPEQGSTGLT